MYAKVVALVVIMAAVAMAEPIPQPRAAAEANPGYTNSFGRYIPTNEDFANPASQYYNLYAVGPSNVNPYRPSADPFVINPAAFPQGYNSYTGYNPSRFY